MAFSIASGLIWGLLAALPFQTWAGTVNLPSYPLAVKSPYLSAWVPGKEIQDAATAQPVFWAGQDLTWVVLARVNGVAYSLFGAPGGVDDATAATTTAVSYTSSHTLVTVTAGEASFTLDFFSPVFPSAADYARQSLPYSYLTVSATSLSSKAVDIQVLSAIDYTWTAQKGASQLNYTEQGSAGFYWFFNPNQILFTEASDMATWGSVVYGTTSGNATSNACGAAATIYKTFTSKGTLPTSNSCVGTDLATLAKDFGNVKKGSVTFTIGFERAHSINYLGASQTGYYRSQWPSVRKAAAYAITHYSSALAKSNVFDADVRKRSEEVSDSFGGLYADIVEASVRQTFGALELTVPATDLKASPPSAFLKEISSDGNINTVDLIYQSWPVFISLNPEYLRLLFQPILSYLALPQSEGWAHPWVIHDIGTHYPNATGHNNGVAESMPLFETSTLFILLYAYQKFSGDKSWVNQYIDLLDGYAEYLAQNSLYPSSQLISVDAIPASANQTGLAVQSVIGLKAAGILTGNSTYTNLANEYAKIIYNDALGLDGATLAESTHFTYHYGDTTTWNVLFPSFSDVVLELNTFPSSAWELQSSWYLSVIQEEGLAFAGPVTDTSYTGTGITWGLTDWNVVAAAASSTAVQEAVINTTHAFLTNGLNSVPFGTKYYVQGTSVGKWIANKARSTVGSHFALVALYQGTWSSL